ncbi:MAG: zinc ribbon domain-containing protein [Anaerolineales bacterium]
MITCPQCKHEEPEGAFFCSECGARLIRINGLQTHSIRQNNDVPTNLWPESEEKTPLKAISVTPSKIPEGATVYLRILPLEATIPLTGQTEFTIGRTSKGQSIMPDIDLSAFDAYAKGVSRLHAAIRIENGEISLMDLGSVNGTQINKIKIPPNMYRRIQPGDIITLGKLGIQIIVE